MEELHLTYDEVVNVIPYRNLLIMQKDKLHVATGDVMHEVTEKDMGKKFVKG